MARLGFLDLCDRARAAIAKGDFASGRKHFEAALELKPDSVEAHYGLATACYLSKDFDAAFEHFNKVQALDPLHAGAAVNLGALYNLRGEYDEAINHLRRGIQLDRTRSEGYYNLGIAYRKQGRNELAIQAYREAHHLNPRMVEALFNLANIYFEMERFDQAISHYRQVLEVNPGFRKAKEGLTRALRKMQESQTDAPDDDEIPETSSMDVFEENPKLERLLDPARDLDLLTEMHRETGEARDRVAYWLKLNDQLDAATRRLAIVLSADSPTESLDEALERFRGTLSKFKEGTELFGQSCDALTAYRERLIENA